MVENGSSGGAQPLPPGESHSDWHEFYFELCAVATTGSLSTEEQSLLKEHVVDCSECRERLAQYDVLISSAIPPLFSDRLSTANEGIYKSWSKSDMDKAEADLLSRIGGDASDKLPKAESLATGIPSTDAKELQKYVWMQYAAAFLLTLTLGVALYRVGLEHGQRVANVGTREVTSPPEPQNVHSSARQPVEKPTVQDQLKELVGLRAQLDDRSNEISRLQHDKAQLESQRSAVEGAQQRAMGEQAEVLQRLQVAQAHLTEMEEKLREANAQQTAEAAKTATLSSRVRELSSGLEARDQELAREQELLDHDRDIRELMGSRDLLYVREVYDVAGTGTQKPFGRVFYTKSKQLTFYAFDLDQQPGVKAVNTFQVWGRRGAEQDQAVSLGVLFQDSASEKRWVMKSSNAKSLSDIDAVFVTAEPTGGSKHPSGKPFLFAYLKMAPNHP